MVRRVYTITDSGVLGAYQDLLTQQQNTLYESTFGPDTGFEPQDGSGFVENYNQTHSYTNFEPQDGSDFVENYTNTHSYNAFEPQDGSDFVENYIQTHSYAAFEPQEGTDFIENYNATHSYSLEGDMDALAYELNLIDNNEF